MSASFSRNWATPPLIEVERPQSHIPRPAKYATGGCLELCFDFTGNVGVYFDVSCIRCTRRRAMLGESDISAFR